MCLKSICGCKKEIGLQSDAHEWSLRQKKDRRQEWGMSAVWDQFSKGACHNTATVRQALYSGYEDKWEQGAHLSQGHERSGKIRGVLTVTNRWHAFYACALIKINLGYFFT